jgi:hypothetical protein
VYRSVEVPKLAFQSDRTYESAEAVPGGPAGADGGDGLGEGEGLGEDDVVTVSWGASALTSRLDTGTKPVDGVVRAKSTVPLVTRGVTSIETHLPEENAPVVAATAPSGGALEYLSVDSSHVPRTGRTSKPKLVEPFAYTLRVAPVIAPGISDRLNRR